MKRSESTLRRIAKDYLIYTKKEIGITLVALVITIIILLILAGISISSLTNNGLFEKAKEAEQKSQNSQIEENSILSQYENIMNDYVSSTREGTSKIRSLINVDDGVYNKTDRGYIFNTPTTTTYFTSNNVIQLTDSVENYDYIVFEYDLFHTYTTPPAYVYPTSETIASSRIKETSSEKMFMLVNDAGDIFNRIFGYFEDDRTMIVNSAYSSHVHLTKIRITDIKGIKY